eukprot:UN31304
MPLLNDTSRRLTTTSAVKFNIPDDKDSQTTLPLVNNSKGQPMLGREILMRSESDDESIPSDFLERDSVPQAKNFDESQTSLYDVPKAKNFDVEESQTSLVWDQNTSTTSLFNKKGESTNSLIWDEPEISRKRASPVFSPEDGGDIKIPDTTLLGVPSKPPENDVNDVDEK